MAVLLRIGENEATGIKESRLAATAVLKACERIAARDFPSPDSPSLREGGGGRVRSHPSGAALTSAATREPGRREATIPPQGFPSAERPQVSTTNLAGSDARSSPSLGSDKPVQLQPTALSTAAQPTPAGLPELLVPSPSHRITASPSHAPSSVSPLIAHHSSLTTSPSPTLPNAPIAGNSPRQPITYPSAARTEPLHPRPP